MRKYAKQGFVKPGFLSMLFIFFGLVFLVFSVYVWLQPTPTGQTDKSQTMAEKRPIWDFRSIDTMKYSRDLAREKNGDLAFLPEIDKQVSSIAGTGANFVGIATPYDEEFVPYLTAWVNTARKYGLHVWFRGNWSAWEGWFDHKEGMSYEEHIAKSVEFVTNHSDLIASGDAFTACPECENGLLGDPRETGRINEYRKFLISESQALDNVFKKQSKSVNTHLVSMNMDVAKAVMNADTANALGGIITIDHYVSDAQQLARDAKALSQNTGASVVLGEFGAPIPDINGNMTEKEQADWLEKALGEISNTPEIVGLSYWVNKGGSTQLWSIDNKSKEGVRILTKYYSQKR